MTHRTSSTSFPHRFHRRLLSCVLTAVLTTGVSPAHAQVTTEQLDALRPRNIGPAVMSGRIVDLAVAESDPIKFYVASATGGVYK
ncbi:MAG: hypothetical protein OXI12_10900, partial [Gammaproteobacteria bacterium]|nr:hypothetical protein [Gammaproteobacteria bacterium]